MPVDNVSWGSAARFCNWLDNGQPVRPEGNGTTETGAYTLNGATTGAQLMIVVSPSHSGSGAPKYFLPSENEWYKAAYYDASNGTYWTYPTQSNTVPSNLLSATGTNNANFCVGTFPSGCTDPTNYLTQVGAFTDSPGPYGTYDMGGDVWQWNEANINNFYRGSRGGAFGYDSYDLASSTRVHYPPDEDSLVGFRVAEVPEPGSITLLLAASLGLAGVAVVRWRRSTKRYRALPAA
jgi:formylglycine-generating enzyme required for sulfatase activity